MKERQDARLIRSYVKRQGRLTSAQHNAWHTCWPQYGLQLTDQAFAWQQVFANQNPVILDIGFGHGESSLNLATHYADHNIVGIEVHTPGIGHCLWQAAAMQLTNLRIICHDIVDLLATAIEDLSLQRVYILFPDPWQKRRHHKRRLIQSAFIAQLVRKLQPGGILHIATDWQDYATQIMAVLAQEPCLVAQPATYSWRPPTKYARRGLRLGHQIADFVYSKHVKI